MRIIELRAENIKKLKAVRIRPDGSLVQITGANDSGKSSVIDAIWWALGGQKGIEEVPVRIGEKKGLIELDIGDQKPEFIVRRRLTAEGGTSLVVEAVADGEGTGAEFKSPQSKLDKMLGALTFDPLAFSRMDPKAQLDELRKLVTLDVDIDQIDFDNRRDFEERTAVNRSVKDLAARIGAIQLPDPMPEEIDVGELAAEMGRAAEHNRLVDQEIARRAQRGKLILEQGEDMERIDRQIEALQQTRDQIASAQKMNLDLVGADDNIPEKRDLAPLQDKIAGAQTTNAVYGRKAERDRIAGELAAAEGQSAKLTQQMEERTKVRQAAITAAKMPIEGLGFGDGFVTHNGVPFQQASSAQQLRASVAIAMAGKPTLRVMRIKDGSLLDENGLALLEEMAEQNDWQIWIERVDTSGKSGIVMEDGEVAGAPPAE